MTTPPVRILRADRSDAGRLATFARQVFEATFAPDNDPADMAAYLETTFTEAHQAAALAEPDRVALLVEASGILVAYAMLRDGATSAHVRAGHTVELERFYVDHDWHGRGVAALLMTECVAVARAWGGDVLWLGVWERNAKAIRFYEKQGFNDVGTQTFVLGADVQMDRVMMKALG